MKKIDTDEYLETNMKVVEEESDKKRLCKWTQQFSSGDMKASLCLLPLLPATNTLVFKVDPIIFKALLKIFKSNMINIVFVKDDNYAKEITGYSGDST